jgi:hypothetical protein
VPVPVAANTSVAISGSSVGGFLCTANGTITLTTNPSEGKAGVTLINAMSVTAGNWYKLPFYLGRNGGTFTTASSGAGVLAV